MRIEDATVLRRGLAVPQFVGWRHVRTRHAFDKLERGEASAAMVASLRVAILMCTKDGEAFIGAQLSSLARQSHKAWSLHVSDDGSSDATLDNVVRFAHQQPENLITIRRGPNARGGHVCQDPRQAATANFLSLISDSSIIADLFALCDQDDVWSPEKLAFACQQLANVPDHIPALYCGRTRLIDESGRVIGRSHLFGKAPSFQNALVQSIAGGNTMVFNCAARNLIASAGAVDVVAHDWWIYLLVTAAGGRVFYDPNPRVDYRQHGSNLVGSNAYLVGAWKRLRLVMSGGFTRWIDLHRSALDRVSDQMPLSTQNHLIEFEGARRSDVLKRLKLLLKGRVYRQTLCGQIAMLVALLMKKF